MQDPLDPTISLPAHVRALRRIGIHPLDAAAGTHGLTGATWAVPYSDANGYAVMAALGAAGTVLQSTGVAAAPAFSTVLASELGAGGNWKVLYSNGSGVWTELALGANNTVLKGEGASSAPTFGQVLVSELGAGGNWKVLYSNGSGAWTELALGAAGTYLAGNGVSSAPTFAAITTYTAKYMTADRTRASSTLADETDLTVAVLANTVYLFEFGLLAYNQNVSTADIKLAFTAPASPTRLAWGAIGAEIATTSAAATLMSHTGFTSGAGIGYGLLLNTVTYIKGSGILQNGANAGSLTLQWAQNSTDAVNLTSLLQGSHMIVYPG